MVVGAALGSVVFAILLLFLVPGTSGDIGHACGRLVRRFLGPPASRSSKIRQGNLEARELVEDREWKRILRRERGKSL